MNKKTLKKLEHYLEDLACFRDYEILPRKLFGSIYGKATVHQCVDAHSVASDAQRAINVFCRDGYSRIVFYID